MIKAGMILAAGLGQRMRPLTDTTPKPLLVVGGKTMLARAFESLENLGVSKVVVNSHYLAPQIAAAVLPGTIVSHEKELLDTGGGIKKALPHFEDQPFFVLNGDSIWAGSLAPLRDAWDPATMDALLLLVKRENAHGYDGKGDFDMNASGSLSRGKDYVYTGVQVIHPRVFADTPHGAFSMNHVWNKCRLSGITLDGEWFHIGTPAALSAYNETTSRTECFT